MIDYYKQRRGKYKTLLDEINQRINALDAVGRDSSHLHSERDRYDREYVNYAKAIFRAHQSATI